MQLQPNEAILAEVRQHWITLIGPVIVCLVIAAVELMALLYFNFDFFGYGLWVYSAITILTALAFAYNIYIWWKNDLVATNMRIIQNEQFALFDQKVTELIYRDITDISITQDGIIATALDYGTLDFRTASEDQVTLETIPHPRALMELLNQTRSQVAR